MRTDLAYRAYLETKKNEGLLRRLTPVSPSNARQIAVGANSCVNFSGNDYLALSAHPKVIERARDFAACYGAGCGASRLVTGNLKAFAALEDKVARLKGHEAALVFASGFQANASILQALFDKAVLKTAPLVFADRLNHASMHFGCASAGVRQKRYRHLDLDHLADLLAKHEDEQRPKFILTESVFSMDGDVADMARLRRLADRHDCTLICDDAHATGILGAKGAGLSGGADISIGTFSKGLGGFGAYLACSALVRDYIINHCAGFIYSTAPPPAVLGAMEAALDLLPALDLERAHVARLADLFRDGLCVRGLDYGASASQIVPVILGSSDKTLAVSACLRDQGFWVSAIRPPTVPAGAARLRVTFNAAHRPEDVSGLLAALDRALEGRG